MQLSIVGHRLTLWLVLCDGPVQDIDVDEFVTHNLPFSDINEAFKLLQAGECLRTVLHFNDN